MAQQTPTADPVVTCAGYESEGHGDGRLIRATADEQAWGGQYTVEIDDSGDIGVTCSPGDQVTLSFNDYDLTLWIENIETTIKEGRQVVILHCIDVWGLLAAFNATLVASYYNQAWQEEEELKKLEMPDGETKLSDVPALYNPLLANGDMTIWGIIQDISTNTGITITKTNDDGIVDSAKPPISVSNARVGLRQLMDMTTLYLKRTGTGLTIINKGGSIVNLNDAWFEGAGQGAVVPNKITFWAYTSDGTDWHSGSDITTDSTIAQTIERHYLIGTLDSKNRRTLLELEQLAQGTLDKLEQEHSLGSVIAPLDDAITLFDQVTGDDVTGYAHRVIREYDRGIYRITVQLNGATSGFTSLGREEPKPLPGIPVKAPALTGWTKILPKAIQGYHHDIPFTASDQDTVTWTGGGTITFYDGSTQAISTGFYNLPNATITYIYFDLDSASPATLKTTTDYPSVMTMKTGLLCMVQKGSNVNINATVIPSYGKEPLITPDVINMTGMVNYDYGGGKYLQHILNTQVFAGYLKLTSNSYKDGEWYNESGVIIDANEGIKILGQDLMLYYGGDLKGFVYGFEWGEAILGRTDVLIYTTANGGISIGAGGLPTIPTVNDIRLEALDDILIEADDDVFIFSYGIGMISLNSANNLSLYAGDNIRLKDDVISDDIDAESTYRDIGSSVEFDEIYCDHIHTSGGIYDHLDDLAMIKQIHSKPGDMTKLDMSSVPSILKWDRKQYMAKVVKKLDDKDDKHRKRLADIIATLPDKIKVIETNISSYKGALAICKEPRERAVHETMIANLLEKKEKIETKKVKTEEKLASIGNVREKELTDWEERFEYVSNHFIPLDKTVSLALGALKQIGDKLEELEGKINDLTSNKSLS